MGMFKKKAGSPGEWVVGMMPEAVKTVGKEWPVVIMVGGVGICVGSAVVAGVVGVGEIVEGVWTGCFGGWGSGFAEVW